MRRMRQKLAEQALEAAERWMEETVIASLPMFLQGNMLAILFLGAVLSTLTIAVLRWVIERVRRGKEVCRRILGWRKSPEGEWRG